MAHQGNMLRATTTSSKNGNSLTSSLPDALSHICLASCTALSSPQDCVGAELDQPSAPDDPLDCFAGRPNAPELPDLERLLLLLLVTVLILSRFLLVCSPPFSCVRNCSLGPSCPHSSCRWCSFCRGLLAGGCLLLFGLRRPAFRRRLRHVEAGYECCATQTPCLWQCWPSDSNQSLNSTGFVADCLVISDDLLVKVLHSAVIL